MNSLDTLCINTIRCLTADIVQRANSGHPGMPMGMAPAAHVLFQHLNFSRNVKWVFDVSKKFIQSL
jgi:transketolase